MFNKSKVRKVNDLLDVAENCLNNKDRENARKAMDEFKKSKNIYTNKQLVSYITSCLFVNH